MRLEFSSFSKLRSVQTGDLIIDWERSMISVYKGSYIYDLVEYSLRYDDFFKCVTSIRYRKWNSEVLDDSSIIGNIKGTKVCSRIFLYTKSKSALNLFTKNLILDTVLNNITDSFKLLSR